MGRLNEAVFLFHRCRYKIFFYVYGTMLAFLVPAKAAVMHITYTNIALVFS